jgi:hypothetical protein
MYLLTLGGIFYFTRMPGEAYIVKKTGIQMPNMS